MSLRRIFRWVLVFACLDASPVAVYSSIVIKADEFDDMQVALDEMEGSLSVAFPQIRVGAIDNWAIIHNQGIALGQVLRFERGESREPLVKCLRYREQYRSFIYQKQRACNLLGGQITRLQSSINQQAIHQQQARLAGVDFNPAGLLGLQTERQAVQQQAAQAEQELATMVEEFQKLDAPIALQFNRLVSNYLKAFDCIQGVDKGNLANVLAALRIADSDTARFAEKVLLGFAMIRNGEDMSQGAGAQVVQELQRLAEVTQSSSVLGLSPINIDRMILSIWCQSDEKLTEEISFIKKDLESRKHPRVLYMLGIYHGSKRQFAEAKRFLRSARAKVDKDARKRGFISAEVLFFELCSDASKDLEAVADLVADVDAWQQNDPNSRMSWQLGRAKAVLASLEGRFDDAKQLVVESRAVAPPLGRKVLDSMSNSFNMNQRFTFESSPP